MEQRPVSNATVLATAARLFVDTAPVIYFVEQHPRYFPLVEPIFGRIDAGALRLIASPITLAECLILPLRSGQSEIVQIFTTLLTTGPSTEFIRIDGQMSKRAAELRVRHNLHLPDAFQAAAGLTAHCDVFLTNDPIRRRVNGLNVIVLDELLTGA